MTKYDLHEVVVGQTISLSFVLSKYFVGLLPHLNERCSARKLLESSSANVGTGRPEATQNVEDSCVDVTSVRNGDSFTFTSSVVSDSTVMLLHRSCRTHTIEELEFLAIFLDYLTTRLIMTSQHASQHDEVSFRAERFANVTWTGASAVRDDVTTETVSSSRTLLQEQSERGRETSVRYVMINEFWVQTYLENGTQLRITNALKRRKNYNQYS